MASSSRCPPWVKENRHEQGIVNESRKYSKMLVKNTVRLCTTIVMVGLWMYLIALGVVDQSVKADLQRQGTNEQQVEGLLEYLLKSPCWKLHGFVKALCQNDQDHVVRQILLLDPDNYVGDKRQKHQRDKFKKEIKDHRDVYNRTLMQGSLFDIPSLDLPYDMEPCYIQLVATEDGFLRNPEDILPADILKPKPGKVRPKTALLSGPPGAGKSSFIRFYVYKWSQMEDGSSDWDLIVILNVSTLQLTAGLSPKEHIKEAIQQSLEGRGDKEAIMKRLNDDRLNILIIPDGLDECGSSMVLEMLRELISSCHKGKLGYTVLSTCRSGLSPIMDSLYNRRMKLDGFKIEEGVQYVNRFYDEIQKPDDDSILDYIVLNQEDLDHILMNPLCTHILSVVTSDGTLKLVKGKRLKLNNLFKAMEKSMKRRQLEKMLGIGSVSSLNENPLQDEIKDFYNMSVWALLKDVRTFDDKVLSLFRINDRHPYFTFMKKTRKYNSDLENISYWNFSHEMFHEFFVASGLESLPDKLLSVLLLTISSHKKFRNTQRILFSALGEDIGQVGKLSDMIRVNLITQGESAKLDPTTRGVIDDVKRRARTDISLNDVLPFLIPGQNDSASIDNSYAKSLWHTIRTLYEDQAELLQKGGFFYHTVESSTDVINHIYDCLHELPEEHQQLVFAESLGHTLPSTGEVDDGTRRILYPTGGTRWSQITEDSHGDVYVDIPFSLTDAAEAVQRHGQHLVTWRKEGCTTQGHYIWLNLHPDTHGLRVRSVWGDPPHDQFLSTTPWSDLVLNISEWPDTAYKLYLQFYGDLTNGVVGFLQCLQLERTKDELRRLLVQDKEGRLRILVDDGHIDSQGLLAWTDWYLQQDSFKVELNNLTCQISGEDSGTRQQQQTRVDSLQHTEHNGCQLFSGLEICDLIQNMQDERRNQKHQEADALQHPHSSWSTESSESSHSADDSTRDDSTTEDSTSRHTSPSPLHQFFSGEDSDTSIPSDDWDTSIPSADWYTSIPSDDRYTSIPSADQYTSIPSADRYTSIPSADWLMSLPSQDWVDENIVNDVRHQEYQGAAVLQHPGPSWSTESSHSPHSTHASIRQHTSATTFFQHQHSQHLSYTLPSMMGQLQLPSAHLPQTPTGHGPPASALTLHQQDQQVVVREPPVQTDMERM